MFPGHQHQNEQQQTQHHVIGHRVDSIVIPELNTGRQHHPHTSHDAGEGDVAGHHHAAKPEQKCRATHPERHRKQAATRGCHALASLELQEAGKGVPQNQRKHHPQGPTHICRAEGGKFTTQVVFHAQKRHKALQEIHNENRYTPPLAEHAHGVRGSDVARAMLPQVNTIQTPGNVAERHRTNQVGCNDVQNILNHVP